MCPPVGTRTQQERRNGRWKETYPYCSNLSSFDSYILPFKKEFKDILLIDLKEIKKNIDNVIYQIEDFIGVEKLKLNTNLNKNSSKDLGKRRKIGRLVHKVKFILKSKYIIAPRFNLISQVSVINSLRIRID